MPDVGGIAADQLRSYVERIERLEGEKANIAADIKQVKNEAKSSGFDVQTINAVIKLRKLDEADRREREELLDLYKAALGMLYDTPLGEAARWRLSQSPHTGAEDDRKPPQAKPTKPDTLPDVTTEDARVMGRKAADDGTPVTDNPFPPHDPRRAAWDEAWCGALGTDGMDIPAALRRRPNHGAGADGNTGDDGC